MSATFINDQDIKEFWREVTKIGWKNLPKGADTVVIKAKLLRDWSPNKTKRMNAVYKAYHDALYKALDNHVTGLGDDSFGDLISHIIGLGKAEYYRNIKNPVRAALRAEKGDFRESFGYCLPSEEDYGLITERHYIQRAERIIEELERMGRYDSKDPRGQLIQRLRKVVNGGPLSFIKEGDEACKEAESLSTDFNNWAVINLVSDIKRYLMVE